MARVRLELNQLRIHRPKERWRIYFVVVADNPANKDQSLVTVIPASPIVVTPEQKNVVNFEPEGEGAEGLLLLSCDLPSSREINVHFYAMHSRRAPRDIGGVLNQVKEELGKDTLGMVEALGIKSPWLNLSRSALPAIGKTLATVKDRQLGFVSMFERFGPEFEQQAEVDREIRGGHITVVYTWSVVA